MLSASIIDVLSVNVNVIFVANDFSANTAALIGFFFQAVILVSSFFVGRQVDKTSSYYASLKLLLVTSSVSLTIFAALMSKNGEVATGDGMGVVFRVFLGVFVFLMAASLGPMQPVSTELAVDIVFPMSEALVLQLFMLSANAFGAVLVPIFELAQRFQGSEGLNLSLYILAFLFALCIIFFQFSDYDHDMMRLEQRLSERGGGVAEGGGVEADSTRSRVVSFQEETKRFEVRVVNAA